MICRECSKSVKNINNQHLKKCSGLDIKQYIKKYPRENLIDDDVKKSFGLKGERNPNFQGWKTIKYCSECNFLLSRNNKSGFCRSCSKKGEKNPFFNKQHSVKTKNKMVDSNKERDKSTYKQGVCPIEKRKEVYEKRWENMSEESRLKMITNFIKAGQKSCKKSYETKIENKIYEILKELQVIHERNYQIGIFNVDFIINEKFIIECFGDYWHCNPSIYDKNFYNKSIKLTSEQKWKKDLNKKTKLKEKGYKIISFWENEILNDIENVRKKILKFLNIK